MSSLLTHTAINNLEETIKNMKSVLEKMDYNYIVNGLDSLLNNIKLIPAKPLIIQLNNKSDELVKPDNFNENYNLEDFYCNINKIYDSGVYNVDSIEDGIYTNDKGILIITCFIDNNDSKVNQILFLKDKIKTRIGDLKENNIVWENWKNLENSNISDNENKNEIIDWDSLVDANLNNYTEPGDYKFYGYRKNNNDNIPILNSGDTINVGFSLSVIKSNTIPMSDGRNRGIIGQTLTLANRIGSENKKYIRYAIYDIKDSLTTYNWGEWKEFVTQTLLGENGLCSDAQINSAINNGIYSGVTLESGILPSYTTFTSVVVNNYAATAAASSVGVSPEWRQICQIFIAVPLVTDGEINESKIYIRTGIGGNSITWGELKPLSAGGEDIMLYTPEANAEVTWDLKKYQNFGCPFDIDVARTVTINIKLDESIPYPYYKKYNLFVNRVSQSSGFICHIQTEKEFDFKYLCKARISDIPFFVNTEKRVTMQDANISLYDTPCMAILHVYFTGTKYYIYMDY